MKLSTWWLTEKSVAGIRITELVERSDFILLGLLGKQKAVLFSVRPVCSKSNLHFPVFTCV